jgi:plasmid maintenance system antidote protein VapI
VESEFHSLRTLGLAVYAGTALPMVCRFGTIPKLGMNLQNNCNLDQARKSLSKTSSHKSLAVFTPFAAG